MAASYVQLLLLVLASLLFLPALCSVVSFGYCNKNGYDYGNVTRVEISPSPEGPEDSHINITVFGYASKRMDNVTIHVQAKSKKTTDFLGGYYICKRGDACIIKSGYCLSEECPLKAGTNFKLPIPGVYVDDLEDEGDFKYELSLHEDDPESVDYDEKLFERMCINFVIPISDATLESA